MERIRHLLRRRAGRAGFALLVLLAAWLGLRGSLAWLRSDAAKTNTFAAGKLPLTVEESFDGTIKRDVRIKNTGNVAGYVRAALVLNWLDGEGNIYGAPPAAAHYAAQWNEEDWFAVGDYYYFKHPLAAGAATENLLHSFALSEAGRDYSADKQLRLELQVLGSGIQAEPAAAVEAAWPVQVGANGQLAPAP